ncbi:RNA-binding S4 domain-containing protein, partial [Streptococcus pseudopneumoniae]|uniref:RNA-binding S4 domain-containing protein n=1 Tax=Streptococcus pseudopneumoniae TaxID=257758 RepID=UPI00202F3E75
MEYKLFEEFITLQALLKELGITHSGGAIKSFLSEHPTLSLKKYKRAATPLRDKGFRCSLI